VGSLILIPLAEPVEWREEEEEKIFHPDEEEPRHVDFAKPASHPSFTYA
jgi:hypothetical protein